MDWKHRYQASLKIAYLCKHMLMLSWQAQRVCFIGLLCLQIIQGTIPLATAWISKLLFDMLPKSSQYVSPYAFLSGILVLICVQAVLSLLLQLTAPLQEYMLNELGRELTLLVKTEMYRTLNNHAGLACFEDPHFHNTIEVTSQQAHFAPLQALQVFFALLKGTITFLSFAGVLLNLHPFLTLFIAISVLPQLFIEIRLSHQRFAVILENSPHERRAAYYGQLLSWVSFAKEIRLFNLGNYFLHKFLDTTRDIYKNQRCQELHELRWQGLLTGLASIVNSVAFLFVIWYAFSGRLSIGDVILYTSTLLTLQMTLSSLVSASTRMHDSLFFFQHYQTFLQMEPSLPILKHTRTVPMLTKGISFQNVSFRYSEQHEWTLRDLSLFIPTHQCLALVGLNGSGKTTLVKLLTRLYDPTEGTILWDDIDIREFDPKELRQQMGAILQDFARYELTAYDNIALGNIHNMQDEASVIQSAIQSGIHERLQRLPRGYHSILSRWFAQKDDLGVDLSGGEWQKLALARLFMRHATIVLLDEPTAALDAEAEFELYEHFRSLMQGRTCLLISHRFTTVHMANTIAILEDGRITEQGTHQELLAQQGTYARLYALQTPPTLLLPE